MDIKILVDNFNKTIRHFQDELSTIRATGAHSSILSKIMIDSYGTQVSLLNAANITSQGGNSLIIIPFDKTLTKEIISAISKSNLGLNAIQEGDKLRVPVPSLTTEKREIFIKEAKEKSEKAKISIRNIRQDFLVKLKNDKSIREDESKRTQDLVQKEVDKSNKEIENILKQKIDSLLKI